MKTYSDLIDKYYPASLGDLRDIYMRHCAQVTELALSIARRNKLPLDESEIETAAMLHDIGIFATDAPSIGCHGSEPYIRHGIIGAELLRSEGMPEWAARVAERHTGAGITVADIDSQLLPLPRRDYRPESLLEQLVCYADKFYSKSGNMKKKAYESVRASLARHSEAGALRFDEMHRMFGDV